jgi:uncharacterized protein YjbI with pentapeptide repeats
MEAESKGFARPQERGRIRREHARALACQKTRESLRGCDLSQQDLAGVYLAKPDLRRANLRGDNSTKAGPAGAHLRGAKVDASTALPTD